MGEVRNGEFPLNVLEVVPTCGKRDFPSPIGLRDGLISPIVRVLIRWVGVGSGVAGGWCRHRIRCCAQIIAGDRREVGARFRCNSLIPGGGVDGVRGVRSFRQAIKVELIIGRRGSTSQPMRWQSVPAAMRNEPTIGSSLCAASRPVSQLVE